MPSREENTERPAFPAEEGRSESHNVRNDSPYSQAEREPVSLHDMQVSEIVVPAAGQSEADQNGAAKESIEDLVSRIIIHDDRPIENLPEMKAPELKLIGRCVSLCVKQSISGASPAPYHYTGLVAAVTATAVTLMHVNRYTHADFKAYKTREHRLLKGDATATTANTAGAPGTRGGTQHRHTNPAESTGAPPAAAAPNMLHARSASNGLSAHGYSAEGEVDVAEDGGLISAQDPSALYTMDAAGSLTPAVPLTTQAQLEAAAAASEQAGSASRREGSEGAQGNAGGGVGNHGNRCKHFRTFPDSVGPIPYVTFLRKSIYDVEFGRDPRSAFYALFRIPAKGITDMQFLRMFVRRYLVHTSEHNNPRQVPLFAFVSVRGAYPQLSRELVNQLVREELPGLLKADRAIEKEKTRARTRETLREREVEQYRAPEGLFSRTGILYLTHIPQSSFLGGAIVVLFAIAFAVFLGIMLSVTADALIVNFVYMMLRNFVASIILWGLCGIFVVSHAVAMHLPLRENSTRLILRVACSLGALGCAIMCVIVVMGKIGNNSIYTHMVHQQYGPLCAFYDAHRCSGFYVGCNGSAGSTDPSLCIVYQNANNYQNGCYMAVWSQVQLVVIPLLVFIIFILIGTLYVLFLVVKLLLLAKALTGHFL